MSIFNGSWEIDWRLIVKLGFPDGSVVKNLPAKPGVLGLTSELERSPGEGNGNPFPFLPGKSHGQRSLVGDCLQGCKRVGRILATKQQRLLSRVADNIHCGNTALRNQP